MYLYIYVYTCTYIMKSVNRFVNRKPELIQTEPLEPAEETEPCELNRRRNRTVIQM